MSYHEGDRLAVEAMRWAFWRGLILLAAFLGGCWAGKASAQDRVFADGFEDPQPGLGPCEHPLVQPEGWQATTKSWQQAWSSPDGSPQATFPNSVGFPVPIGAAKGGYTVIPFVMSGGLSITITWDTAQANGGQGYGAPRPADSMTLTWSECPGDFRMIGGGFDACAMTASGASMFGTVNVAPPTACQMDVGRTYYLNVIAANPQDGLQDGEHTCSDISPWTTFGCDVQAVHRPQ